MIPTRKHTPRARIRRTIHTWRHSRHRKSWCPSKIIPNLTPFLFGDSTREAAEQDFSLFARLSPPRPHPISMPPDRNTAVRITLLATSRTSPPPQASRKVQVRYCSSARSLGASGRVGVPSSPAEGRRSSGPSSPTCNGGQSKGSWETVER